jgi:probable F420-dependent oxidoreductase
VELGGVGVWSVALRYGDKDEVVAAAAELESLGYSALWFPDTGGDVFGAATSLLGATRSIVVATGVLNLWMHDPAETADGFARLSGAHPGRFLLGIGASHAPVVDGTEPGRYRQPLTAMAAYLDAIDTADPPVPPEARVLAALGPKMLTLARERAAGAHPYLTTPEHTQRAREILGADRLLAPEQRVVLETDRATARDVGRQHLAGYMRLPNYTNNLRRLGFTDDDLAGAGSDRLVDALVAWGDEATIARRVREHHDAGADHVCIQALTGDGNAFPREAWRRLAPALVEATAP